MHMQPALLCLRFRCCGSVAALWFNSDLQRRSCSQRAIPPYMLMRCLEQLTASTAYPRRSFRMCNCRRFLCVHSQITDNHACDRAHNALSSSLSHVKHALNVTFKASVDSNISLFCLHTTLPFSAASLPNSSSWVEGFMNDFAFVKNRQKHAGLWKSFCKSDHNAVRGSIIRITCIVMHLLYKFSTINSLGNMF